MDSLIYIIFICFAFPMILSLASLEKKSRLVVFFIIIGAFSCALVSGINGKIISLSSESMFYIKTNYIPIAEEIIKAVPILVFAFAFSDDRNTILTLSMAIGVGFAAVENTQIFISSGLTYSVNWAVKRAFGASLMHGLCTSMVGYGISFVKKRRKLFYTGTFALLLTAITYHSIFNSLVLSDYYNIGITLPIATYVPVVLYRYKDRIKGKMEA